MPKKRAPIPPRIDILRGNARAPVVLSGKCQIGERAIEEALITDLSAGGCCLRANSIGVTKTEQARVWLGEVGPVPARLAWIKQGSIGLAFETALEEAVLRPLQEAPAAPIPSNVVPLKKAAES